MSNAKAARGGISQITIPIQGSPFVTFSWGSFGGDFPLPTDAAALQDAQFNLKLGMVPIGFFGMEAILQSSEVVVPKLRAVMSDAAVVMRQAFGQTLFTNNYANPLAWDSLAQAYDDGTNAPAYGGITRAGQQMWQGQLIPAAGAQPTTRVGCAQILARVQAGAGGEAPDYAVMNPANWTALMTDFMGFEQYMTRPNSRYEADDVVNSGFRGIMVLNTPIFPDPFCPLGSMFVVNSRYVGLYMSEYAPMTFSGFEFADSDRADFQHRRLDQRRRSRLREAVVGGPGHRRDRHRLAERAQHCPGGHLRSLTWFSTMAARA